LRLALPLLVAVAVLSGCGGGKAQTPAQKFADAGNAICQDTRQKSLDLQTNQPTGYRAKLTAVGREGQRQLKALVPPPELRATRNRFFADLAELERVANNPGERPAAVALSNRLPAEARMLGWTVCGR
jgi:hypothetical protein